MEPKDEERLIEEAAKAIDEAWQVRAEQGRHDSLATCAARAAWAVFEAAHAPTDDEREARVAAIAARVNTEFRHPGVWPYGWSAEHATVLPMVAAWAAREALSGSRLSEVPESGRDRAGDLGDLEAFLGETVEGSHLLPALWRLAGVPHAARSEVPEPSAEGRDCSCKCSHLYHSECSETCAPQGGVTKERIADE